MRKASTLACGLILVALGATARAQESAPAPAPPAAPQRRSELGLSFLPMALGRFTSSTNGVSSTADASFAYGVGLSANHMVVRGLIVGLAPQAIFNISPKVDGGNAATQFDVLARVAYVLPIVDTIAVYAELLPGYSFIVPPSGATAKGPVVAFGGGCVMDMTDRILVNLGVDYQLGYQKLPGDGLDTDVRTKYLRVALGGGVRF
jgi:hypothetical protein